MNDTTNQFAYAQIDTSGYCIGISSLIEEVENTNLIKLDEFDTSYLNRKYDSKAKEWTDEYLSPDSEDIIDEHEQITKATHEVVETNTFDNLINMDMLLGLDEKLNLIMEHLGINV